MVLNPTHRDIKKSIPYMEQMSWDEDLEVLARLGLSMNPITGEAERVTAIQGNPSMTITYDVDGNIDTLTKTIGAKTYTKTFTFTAGVLTDISAWV
jgi:hypothetical protein